MADWEELTGFQIASGNLTVRQALAVGVGGDIFDADEEATCAAYLLDAIAYRGVPRLDATSYPGYLLMTFQGCGLRVAIKYTKIAGHPNPGFAQLGVAARAGLSCVSYEIAAPGLGAGALDAILQSLPAQGVFDEGTCCGLFGSLAPGLVSYLSDCAKKISMVSIRTLSRNVQADEIRIAQTVLYGLSAIINHRRSYEQAIAGLAPGDFAESCDPQMIRYAYKVALPEKDETEIPTEADVERAKAWLRLQR